MGDHQRLSGWREPGTLERHLENLLATISKASRTKHLPSLPWQRVGAFMQALRKQEGVSARALEFAILTAGRSGEVRGAQWSEFDIDDKVWTIPAERMKAEREHEVPLSGPVLTGYFERWAEREGWTVRDSTRVAQTFAALLKAPVFDDLLLATRATSDREIDMFATDAAQSLLVLLRGVLL